MQLKRNVLSKSLLCLTISLAISSCDYNTAVSTVDSYKKPYQRYDLTELNKREMGVVSLNFSEQGLFKEKAIIPALNKFQKGLNTKAIDFNSQSIKKLALQIEAYDMTKPIFKQIKWQPNETASFSVPVMAGKDRIISLYALDSGNRILGKIMGALDVIAGQNNTGKISYFETALAQTLLAVSKNGEPDFVRSLNLNELRAYLLNVTGYNEEKNTFSRISPSELNTSLIADNLISNGELPPADDLTGLKATGKVKLDLGFTGARIVISDLNSDVIESSTELSPEISGITPGVWDLTVYKDGYLPQTFEVDVTNLNAFITIELPEDIRSVSSETENNEKNRYKILADILDDEIGISITEIYEEFGFIDEDGASEEYIEGDVLVDGFGKTYIEVEQKNYPIMSNEYDYVEVYDEKSSDVFNLFSDQELQEFGIEFEYEGQNKAPEEFYIEVNFDGSWSFNGEVNVHTPKELAQLIVKHPVFKGVSIYSIAFLYELFANNKKLLSESKTLLPLPGATMPEENITRTVEQTKIPQSQYNSYEMMTETLKETFLLMKAKGNN